MSETSLTRRLGRSDTIVSALGLGCWTIGGPLWAGDQPRGWGEVDDQESVRAIRRAFDLGVTFFDTADVYGAGHSERILGRALGGVRPQVVIATKFGNTFDQARRQMGGTDLSPGYVRRACEASLGRLGTDCIDLYQLHVPDPPEEQALQVREALEELSVAGLIRGYGWSTDDPARAALFAAGPHCLAIQHGLNVFADAGEMLAACDRLDLACINNAPLAMGLLSGKFSASSRLPLDDVRGREPAWLRWFKNGRPVPEYLARLDSVREILTSAGRTLAQGALGWIWARSERTIPIPGFRTVAQVEENAAALRFGPLTPAQMTEIDALLGR